MNKAINCKYLRKIFPKVREDLQKGITFMLIYRSVPIAKIIPIDVKDLIDQEALDKDTISAALTDF